MVKILTTTASSHSASPRKAQGKNDTFVQTHHSVNKLDLLAQRGEWFGFGVANKKLLSCCEC